MTRQEALDHLYDLLDELETRVGGIRTRSVSDRLPSPEPPCRHSRESYS